MTTLLSSPCRFLSASVTPASTAMSISNIHIAYDVSCTPHFAGRIRSSFPTQRLTPWADIRNFHSARQRRHPQSIPHPRQLSGGVIRVVPTGSVQSNGASADSGPGTTSDSANLDTNDAGPHASESSISHMQSSSEEEVQKVNASSSDQNESYPKTLTSLDSYFEKLEASKALLNPKPEPANAPPTPPATLTSQPTHSSKPTSATLPGGTSGDAPGGSTPKVKSTLSTLDSYFDKLRPPPPSPPPNLEDPSPSPTASDTSSDAKSAKEEAEPDEVDQVEVALRKWVKDYVDKEVADGNIDSTDASNLFKFGSIKVVEKDGFESWVQQQTVAEAPWAMNLMICTNILVYILELVTPKLLPGSLITSIPGLYMAKVNDLLVAHEWWRLITPSFLHDGFFHLVSGTLFLGFIGPIVEAAFGSLGFLGIYILGGAFGNLLSFIQTQDITVGGTGPIYALAGAWLVFVIKNREEVGTEYADGEIIKVLGLGILNIWVGSDLPVDNWTHIGASFGGVLYGVLAAPRLRKGEVVAIGEGGKSQSQSQSQSKSKSPAEKAMVQNWLVSEGPGAKQQLWIYALTLGILILCYEGALSETFVNFITNLKLGEDDFRDMI